MHTYSTLLDRHKDYERVLIGAVVLDSEKAHYIFANVSKNLFYTNPSKILYGKLHSLWLQYGKIDITIANEVVSGENKIFLFNCAQDIPRISNYKEYITLLKKNYVKINTMRACEKYLNSYGEEYEEFLNDVNSFDSESEKENIFEMTELVKDFKLRKITNRSNVDFIRAGIGLDKHVRLKKGEMIVIGARPSVGKTTYALQLALNMNTPKQKIVFFSLETSAEILFDKLISNYCGYNHSKLQDNEIDFEAELEQKNLLQMEKLNITIVEASGKSVSWIESEAIRLGADVVIIDYLTLIHDDGKTLYEKATNISKDLHTMAQRRKILTIVLAQLNRAGTGEPSMEHLRESGQIEQDSDVIILLHRTDANTVDEETTAIIVKNKKGSCGKVLLHFDKMIQRITAVDTIHQNDGFEEVTDFDFPFN